MTDQIQKTAVVVDASGGSATPSPPVSRRTSSLSSRTIPAKPF
jgi:hypothetical protein